MHLHSNIQTFQNFLENIPTAVAMLDRHMCYLAVSKQWLQDYNLQKQNLIGFSHYEIFPDFSIEYQAVYKRCLAGAKEECKAHKILKKDGSYELVKSEIFPWYECDGEVGGIVIFNKVIEDREQIKEALQISDNRFQKLAANLPGVIFQILLDTDDKISCPYISQGCRRLLGFEQQEIIDKSQAFLDLIHPEDYQSCLDSMMLSRDTLLPWLWEGRLLTFSGSYKWVRCLSRPEQQDNHDILWDGLIIDIGDKVEAEEKLHQYQSDLEAKIQFRTAELQQLNEHLQSQIQERNQAEAALRKSEARFKKLVNNVPGMLYQYVLCPDGDGYFSYISPGCQELYELNPDYILQDPSTIFNLIYNDDKSLVEESLNTSAQTLRAWNIEYRITTPSGKVKWIQGHSRPEMQVNGDVVWNGFMTDITERKQAEEKLRSSERKFRTLFDKSADGILLYDGEVFFDCNQAAAEMMGCQTKEQFLSLSPDPLKLSPEYQPDGSLSSEKALGVTNLAYVKGSHRFEWTHRRIDETYFPLEVLLTSIPLDEKDVFYTVWRDITDRKQAEEGLQQSESKFRKLFDKSADGILLYDGEVFFDCNQAAAKMMGCQTREQFLSLNLAPPKLSPEFQPDGSLSSEKALEVTNLAYVKGSHRFEWTHRRIDGTYFPVEVLLTSIPLNGKDVFYTVWRDITDRKKAEKALKFSEAQYKRVARQEKLLNRLASQIRKSLNLDTVIQIAIHEIRDLLQIDRCSFSWFTTNANPPIWETVKEARNPDLPSLIGRHSIEKVGPVTELFIRQEILKIDDASECEEPIHRQFLESLGIKSEIVLPIQTNTGRIGVIVCGHWNETRPWTDSEVELLQAVVDQLAIAIQQAELYTQTQKTATTAQEQTQQLEVTLQELQKTQTQLVQSEKMSGLGQLVAGVAHEINNPVNFIYGNLEHAKVYTQDILELLKLYQKHYPQPSSEILDEIEAVDLDFLIADIPNLINSMRMGAERIREIVQSLRTFSRLDEAEMKEVDIHEGIESTIMILQNRFKPRQDFPGVELVKEYGELPLVTCYAGQLNQVFMNLIANAIDALEEAVSKNKASNLTIAIATDITKNNCVCIRISDNGIGIKPEVQKRLFDPFFTTKPVGVGTGLGLSISYQIIVEKHGGQLHCNSQLSKGTEFLIEIPLSQPGSS